MRSSTRSRADSTRIRGASSAAAVGPGRVGDVPADVEAVEVGQVQVQADHVVGVDVEPVEGGSPVARDVDRVALPPQAGRHRARQVLFVLDHEDPHARSPGGGSIPAHQGFNVGRRRRRFPPEGHAGEADGRASPTP